MRGIAWAVLIGFLAVAIVLAWIGRYTVMPGGAGFYITDHWTGTVYECTGHYYGVGRCLAAYPLPSK
jgi:hypothetical protein